MAWCSKLVLFSILAVVCAQRQVPLPRNRGSLNSLLQNGDGDADVINGDEIPGIAGIDYPVLSEAPRTDFTCDLLKVPGYYADQQAGCQVYYRCQTSGKGVAALCPNGTVFSQEKLVCDWWYNVDCSRALESYKVNEDVVLAMAAIDVRNPNAPLPTPLARLPGLPALAALASGIPSLASRLRTAVTISPFDRRLVAQTALARASALAGPARYSQNGARDNENTSSDGNSASQRYNDSARGKGDKKNDYKSDKEFDGYSYPNPNGIDRSYLPPSK